MLVQDDLTPADPYPTFLLSQLPSDDLRTLTRPVAKSPTGGLGLTERATLHIEIDPEPLSQVAIDRDLVVRVARCVRGLMRRYGLHHFGGHSLARELEYAFSPRGLRSTFDADRGWQLLTLIDASPATGVTLYIEADPLTPYGDRRHMRLHERVAELAARR